MKKIFLTLLAFSIINPLISQDFSPEFLQSLPEDARAELLQSTDKRLADEATQYRRPSTFIKKPREDSDRFGTNYFSMMQSTLMPLNEPNFDPSYILDFGDVIQLQLVGQKNQILEIPILRDGSVNLPDIGKIFLSGMSLEEATKIIKDTYSASFIGVEAFNFPRGSEVITPALTFSTSVGCLIKNDLTPVGQKFLWYFHKVVSFTSILKLLSYSFSVSIIGCQPFSEKLQANIFEISSKSISN